MVAFPVVSAEERTQGYGHQRLLSIPGPPTHEPSAAIDQVLALLTAQGLNPDYPHTILGQLLVARYRLKNLNGKNPHEVYSPPLYLTPQDVSEYGYEMTWASFKELCQSSPENIAGVAMLDLGRRASFWFHSGPGEAGTLQRKIVTEALAELVFAGGIFGKGTLADADSWIMDPLADYSRSIFFSAVDTRYADIIETVSKLVYREPPAKQYVFPDEIVIDEKNTKIGARWTCEKSGKRFFMDTGCAEDFKQASCFSSSLSSLTDVDKNILVKYQPEYVNRALAEEPFISMSRVARLIDSNGNPGASPQGLPASWCLTHINLVVGLTSTAPSFRRLGLATRVCKSLVASQRDWFLNNSPVKMFPQCYVFVTNQAGHAMFTGFGFKETVGREFCWMAVNPK
ncbi:hypothetical protein HDU67_001440 [Dinochytrium kinnereticum]|nr:hypothetical protein HDU67_001440 [Dinochytrium kinnereticum]